ncbi:nuclear transport factor 2 family protein [Paraburkholderia tropica]|uniref:nuclear transport factor 2 family protein n=1 Tax=Paraburkholderia tropica TaxID=92647 RepID=UPI0007ECD877|nr:nuclear transport factor 2 family protein [Paraburkholderia tropica]OBR53135.1 hypothetical protein A6456_09230 [Paraburkholderia tropica]
MQSTSTQSAREKLLRDLTDAWNSQNIDRVMACFEDDASFHAAFGPEPLGQTFEGKDAVRNAIAEGFRSFPDGKLVNTSLFVADSHAAAEWSFSYTDANGKSAAICGTDVYQFAGDKLKSKNVYVKYFVG